MSRCLWYCQWLHKIYIYNHHHHHHHYHHHYHQDVVIVVVVVVVIIIIIRVLFILGLINPEYRGGSSLTALLSVPLKAFLSGGRVSVRTIARQPRAEADHFSTGFFRATSYEIEFLDFLQPTIIRMSLWFFTILVGCCCNFH